MNPEEFAAQVEDLEKKVERLRALYEQYFLGFERTEPGVLRNNVERQFRALRRERCPNTAQRFRFQTLIQRYTTLSAYWQRTCRAIEEGTYLPHVLRAQRRLAREAAEAGAEGHPAVGAYDLTEALEPDLEPDAAPPASTPAAPVPPPPPGAKRARSLEELKRLLEAADGGSSPVKPPAEAMDGSPVAAPGKPWPTPPPGAKRARSLEELKRLLEAADGGSSDGSPVSGPAACPGRPAEARMSSLAAASSPATGAAPGGGGAVVSEEKVRAIHAAFAAAVRGAPVPSPAAIRRSLERELERMSRKHPGRRVDFRVDVKDGKPVIKSFVT